MYNCLLFKILIDHSVASKRKYTEYFIGKYFLKL